MKKIMMSAAVLALLATSCQNEVLVEQSQDGQLFTIELSKSIDSRTILDGNATHWSETDAIYLSGQAGAVRGILKFKDYVGGDYTRATFSGFIYGGQPSKLQHIVFPAPVNGVIDMSNRDKGELDAPMIGTLENGVVTALQNVGSLMAIDVNGNEGDVFGFKATSGSNNMTGGEYRFNPEAGTLTYYPIDNVVEASVAEDGYIYVPVATTTNAIVAGNVEETSTNVNIVVSDIETESVLISGDNITVESSEIIGDDEEIPALQFVEVASVEEYNKAYQTGANIKFSANIQFDSWNSINNENKSFIIDLNNKELSIKGNPASNNSVKLKLTKKLSIKNGVIKSQLCTQAEVYFENVLFNPEYLTGINKASALFVSAGFDGNVTLKNCTFDVIDRQLESDYLINAKLTFIDCIFPDQQPVAPSLNTLGAEGKVTFRGCTFGWQIGGLIYGQESQWIFEGNTFNDCLGTGAPESGYTDSFKSFVNDVIDNNIFKGEHKLQSYSGTTYFDKKF